MANVLYAVDMDRTLTNEAAISEALGLACASIGFDYAAVLAEQNRIEAAGHSFQVLDYLREQLEGHRYDRLIDGFKNHAIPEKLLFPEVNEFIARIHKLGAGMVILTYGPTDWQQLKLQAAGLHEFLYVITDTKQKGPLIASWKTSSTNGDVYDARVISGSSVVLVDDKAVSFSGLPNDCSGFLVRRPDEPLMPSQLGDVPPQVHTVENLLQVL